MTADHRAERRADLLALLDAEALDGLIVTHPANIRYLTGFTGTAAIAVVSSCDTLFVTDSRYKTQAELEVGAVARLEVATGELWSHLWQLLGQNCGLKTLGFESQAVSVCDAERLASAESSFQLRPLQDLVESLRSCKHADEVAAIREAAGLAGAAFEATLGSVRPGSREIDIAVKLESELRLRGSDWFPFQTIVASGPRSALPHARTSQRVIESGDLLLLDFGAQVDGYCADITRTVVVGRAADERQRAIYEVVREAQQQARGKIQAGMTGRDADSLARSIIEAHGFGDAFGHSLGHGLGLEVHEAPRVSKTNDSALPAGAVVTVEPGIYLAGWGGVRIEDDVYLGPNGAELLSDGATELQQIK